MPLLRINKDFSTIMNNAMQRIENSEVLTEISRGGVARLLLAVFNEEFAKSHPDQPDGLYDILKRDLLQAYLSYATEDALDAIGNMLYCKRIVDEDDERYRWRISQQMLSLATSNEMAVRLACLSVPGVDDVVMRPFTHGTGSGSIYIINNDPNALPGLIEQVSTAARQAGAFGTRIEAFSPRFLKVAIRIRVFFFREVSDLDRELISNTIKIEVEDYLRKLNGGEELDVPYIKELVAKASDQILDQEIYYLTINNEPVLPVKQTCAWNERFIPTDLEEAVIISH